MTTLSCDLCDVTAEGATFEEWMQNLHPHYMAAHKDVIENPNHTEEDMKKWMVENKARFDAAAKS